MREVERAVFKRGAEAIRELAAQRLASVGGKNAAAYVCALPVDIEADRAFDAVQPSLGTPVPPERRIRRQADVDAAFARGAEAMRTALLQRVSWGSDLADRIRDEPVPEDK